MCRSSVITIKTTWEAGRIFCISAYECGHTPGQWRSLLPKCSMEIGMMRVSICGVLDAFFLQCSLVANPFKLNSNFLCGCYSSK